jgi:hypothetical protein
VTGLNSRGDIAGRYTDSANVMHGFVRTADGTVTSFDGPGAPLDTVTSGINARGYVVGAYVSSDSVEHGFLRAPDGTITSFDYPDTQVTYAEAIDDRNKIVGFYQSDFGTLGFLVKE